MARDKVAHLLLCDAQRSLIAVDLDGTLLRSDHTMSPSGARALAQAAREGAHVILSTTRNPDSACAFAREIGLSSPLICTNGAQIWASPDGPVWINRAIPMEVASAVATLADAHGWPLVTTVGETTFYRRRSGQRLGPSGPHRTVVATNMEALSGEPVRMLSYDAEAIRAIRTLLLARFPEQVHLETYYNVDESLRSLGVFAAGADKGTALSWLMARLDVARSNVMAIGDNPNDLPMFRCAAVRVAMSNATTAVKQRATIVAPSNDNHGVAWAVKKYALEG